MANEKKDIPTAPKKKLNKATIIGISAGAGAALVLGLGLGFGLAPKSYEIKLEATNTVAVLSGSKYYKEGEEVELVAGEINGFRFVGWEFGEEIVSTQNPYKFNMSYEKHGTYTAVYEKIYSLSQLDTEHGQIRLEKTSAITGEEVRVFAGADDDYKLDHIYFVDETGTHVVDGKTIIMPSANIEVGAVFVDIDYLVDLTNVQPESSVFLKDGRQRFIKEEYVEVVIRNPGHTPTRLYYIEDGKTEEIEITLQEPSTHGEIAVSQDAYYGEFYMPKTDIKLYVVFTEKEYNITTDVQGNGAINVQATAKMGERIVVDVQAGAGYELSELYLMEDGNDVDHFDIDLNAFTMVNCDVKVYAVFSAVSYGIEKQVGEHGSVQVAQNAYYGDEINLTIVTDTGYEVDELYYVEYGKTVDDKVDITGTTFNMPASRITLYATFKKIDYTITKDVTGEGTVVVNATANYQDIVTVTVTPTVGYEITTLEYYEEGDLVAKQLTHVQGNEYTLLVGTKNIRIVAVFSILNYSVSVDPLLVGATIVNGDETPFTITNADYGTTIKFKVVLDEAYNRSEDYEVQNNGTMVTPDANGVYTIVVTNNVNITVAYLEINEYNIVLPDNMTGYTLTNKYEDELDPTTTIEHCEDFEFKVILENGYHATALVVSVNGVALSPNGVGVYKFEGVSDDLTITVEGVEVDTYTVTLPLTMNHYTITNADDSAFTQTVAHGSALEFKVAVEEGYHATSLTVEVNGNEITPDGSGVYTVSNITSDATITITIIAELNEYNVNLPATMTGYTITNESGGVLGTTITHGDTLSFKVNLSTGYHANGLTVLVNDNAASYDSVTEVYSVATVTGDVTISVSGVEIDTCTATIPATMTGYSILVNDTPVTADQIVEYNETFRFKVQLEAGYHEGADFAVKINGVEIMYDIVEDAYIVENVTANFIITVEGVEAD